MFSRHLTAERKKFWTTRSGRVCLICIVLTGVAVTGAAGMTLGDSDITVGTSQYWMQMGLIVAMVMAVLATAGEFHHGTAFTTVVAAPQRIGWMLAKTLTVAIPAAVAGLLTGVLSYGLLYVLSGNPADALALQGFTEWRMILGAGLLFFVGAVVAVGLSYIIRSSAITLVVLLVWALVIENLVPAFGDGGRDVAAWFPFYAGSRLIQPETVVMAGSVFTSPHAPNWWQGALWFAAFGLLVWAAGALLLQRRDLVR